MKKLNTCRLWLINEQRNITNNCEVMTDVRGNLIVLIDNDGSFCALKAGLKIHCCLIPASILFY